MSKTGKGGGGYCNPPVHTRWKKGQSGNPNGRPKKDKSLMGVSAMTFRKIMINAGLQPIEVTEKGKKRKPIKLHVIATHLVNKAVSGNLQAAALYIKLLEHYTVQNDKYDHEWILEWSKMQEQLLRVQNKKGSLEHYNVMYKYYMFKKDMRKVESADIWPYEDDEPKTNEDWAMFISYQERLVRDPKEKAPWPLKYPSEKWDDS